MNSMFELPRRMCHSMDGQILRGDSNIGYIVQTRWHWCPFQSFIIVTQIKFVNNILFYGFNCYEMNQGDSGDMAQ